MPAGSFEKNSFGWQLGQLQQRAGEWFELKTTQTLSKASFPSWLNSPILYTIAQVAFWITVALLVIWALWQSWQLLRPYFYSLTLQQSENRTTHLSADELTVTAWLQRSQKFQQQGNYREACRCLYMAMLQRLNDAGIAPHQPSRTDGEYLQIIQQLPQPQPYQILLATHQRLCFSNAQVSSSVFEQCQQAYGEIKDEGLHRS